MEEENKVEETTPEVEAPIEDVSEEKEEEAVDSE